MTRVPEWSQLAASPLARLQAAAGGRVTNLRHESAAFGDIENHFSTAEGGCGMDAEVCAGSLKMPAA
jgi:hypothetical protein